MQDLVFQRTVNFSELCIFSVCCCLCAYRFIYPSTQKQPTARDFSNGVQVLPCPCFHSPRSCQSGSSQNSFFSVYKVNLIVQNRQLFASGTLPTGYEDGRKLPATYFWGKVCNINCGFLFHRNKSHCIFKTCLHLYVRLITHKTKGESQCSKPYGAINNKEKGLVTEVMAVGIVQGPLLLLIYLTADSIAMQGAEGILKDTQIPLKIPQTFLTSAETFGHSGKSCPRQRALKT